MLAEIVFLVIRNGLGNLFPLAMIFNLVWFIGPFTLANIGEALSKSTSGRNAQPGVVADLSRLQEPYRAKS